MSEIETREGVGLDGIPPECVRALALILACEPRGANWRKILRPVFAELRAARTPAQTQTFKDGFAAGLEAAAKVADNIAVLGVKDEFHRGYQCAAKAIAGNVRALKEPS